jgi:putative acetyltransferase
MKHKISIRDYRPNDVQALANIYFNTIHRINTAHYTQEQVDVWAPKSSIENTEGWAKKFSRTKPIVAVIGDAPVGFAEFEPNGHIDCFYCHHDWIRKGVGAALMNEILFRAKNQNINRIFSEVSITAKPFFEKQGFIVIAEQTVLKRGVGLINYRMEKSLHQ